MKKPLLCIMGCSGSGKTTLCNELSKKHGLKSIPSYTTRKPRHEEDTDHTYVTTEEFDTLRDQLCAYAKTTGAEYGVTYNQLEDEQYTLYVIDNSGMKYLRENYKGKRQLISVFITCPFKERYERMRGRGDSVDDAIARLVHDAVEFKDVEADYRIENPNGLFDTVLIELECIGEIHGLIKRDIK